MRHRLQAPLFLVALHSLTSCGGGELEPSLILESTPTVATSERQSFTNDGLRVTVLAEPRLRQDEELIGADYLADGRRILTGGRGGSVRVWDAVTGRELFSLSPSPASQSSVLLSGDRRRVAQLDRRSVRVWEVDDQEEIWSFPVDRSLPYGLRVSEDASRVMTSATTLGSIKVWDSEQGRVLLDWEDDPDKEERSFECDLSFDGRIALVSRRAPRELDKPQVWEISVWDVDRKESVRTLKVEKGSKCRLLPDGERFATAGDDVSLWDLTTGEKIQSLAHGEGRITSYSFSSDASRVATGRHGPVIQVFDVASGAQVPLRFEANQGFPKCQLKLSPTGDRLIATFNRGIMRQWDLHSGKETPPWTGERVDHLRFVHWAPDGKKFASGDHRHGVKVWRADGRVIAKLSASEFKQEALCAAFARDGGHLLIGTGPGWGAPTSLHRWDFKSEVTGYVRKEPCNRNAMDGVAWSEDGRAISVAAAAAFVHGPEEDPFTKDGEEIRLRPSREQRLLGNGPSRVAFHPDRTQALLAADRRLTLWNLENGELLRTWDLDHGNSYSAIAFSASGDSRLTACSNHDFVVTPLSNEGAQIRLTGHQAPVQAIACSVDGRWIIAGAADRTLRFGKRRPEGWSNPFTTVRASTKE